MSWVEEKNAVQAASRARCEALAMGLASVLARLEHYRGLVGAEYFTPAPELQRRALGGLGFYDA